MPVKSRQRGISLIGSPTAAHVPGSARGFTLVELMVTLVVAVVLIMIAIPNFKSMILSNKLTTVANDLVASINIAKMEAIKRNGSVQLCSDSATNNTSDTLGTACSAVTPGAVVVQTTLSGNPTPTVRDGIAGLVSPLKLNGSMVAVRFSGTGQGMTPGTTTPYGGTVADICTSAISTNNHRIVSLTAGNIVDVQQSSGSCP